MDSNFADRWIRKFRIITLSLIFSGALNIGLIATMVAFLMKDRENAFSFSTPRAIEKVQTANNLALLTTYSHSTFRELCSLLTNNDIVEDGFCKRDLALAALVSFHDFNIEQALGGAPAQKRQLKIDDTRLIELFPGLSDEQFQAILHYAYLERWPLTSKGLFTALQKSGKSREETLVQAFTVTKEFYAIQTLFQKSACHVSNDLLVDLVCDGNWQMLDGFVMQQSQMLDLSETRREQLLLSYLAMQSPAAADLLLQTDFVFALKRLDDKGIATLIDRARDSEQLRKFCIELLQSARCDAIRDKSAQILYRIAKEEMPQPFDRAAALARFVPAPPKAAVPANRKIAANRETKQRTHVVTEGESLWKIARQYHVKLDELIALNKLEKDKLKPGMILKIPASVKESDRGRPDEKGGTGPRAAKPAKAL